MNLELNVKDVKWVARLCNIAMFIWIIIKVIIFAVKKRSGVHIPEEIEAFFEFSVFLILAFFSIFLNILSHTQLLPVLLNNLEDFNNAIKKNTDEIDKLNTSGIEVVKSASSFMERAFGLQVITRLREKFNTALLEALQALGFNLRNWENHITIRSDDDLKINLWLRYMRTYYFEEAFDIRRKEVVTNGRNFCFMLLATVQAFLENVKEKEGAKLHYYAVTPVNPKDWYNWPHGYEQPKVYYEEDFIGLFYRMLREIISSGENKSKIEHGRFVLTAKGVKKKFQQFGWQLDEFEDVKKHMQNTWMLPISMRLKDIKDINCDVVKAFHTYYTWISSKDRFTSGKNDPLFVPLFCKDWTFEEANEWFAMRKEAFPESCDTYEVSKQKVKEAWAVLKKNTSGNGKELVRIAKEYHLSELRRALENIRVPENLTRCCEAYSVLSSMVANLVVDKSIDFPSFINQVHYYDVLLAEHDQRDKQDYLKTLLYSALHLSDCHLMSKPTNPWPSLGKVFTENLHTVPELCTVVGLDRNNLKHWHELNIKPEFSFFGIEDQTGNVAYKLIIATELDYPFEVGKIKFIEEGDAEWGAYMKIIQKLKDGITYDYYKFPKP